MKNIFAAVSLITLSSLSFGQSNEGKWTPLTSSMFVMSSQENEKIMLSAGIDSRTADVTFRILDITGTLCKDGVTGNPETMPPLKINNRYIKIVTLCINGSRIVMPETAPGRGYFNDLINSGATVTIEYDSYPILHFKGRLPSELRQKLLAAQKAM